MAVERSSREATSTDAAGKVWVVEDSRLEAERICQLLSRHYQVESFLEGGAMLERISEGPAPDLILLDWQMPGVSGLEVCRFLRERHDEVSLPILMLTGRGAKEDFREGLSAGANDYVAKPYDDAELLARVRTLVRTRKQADAIRAREEWFSTTLRSIGEGVITTDVDGHITFLNRAAEQLTGWRQEEALGRPVGEVFHLLDIEGGSIPEDPPRTAVLRGHRTVEITNRMMVVRSGGHVPIEASAGPIGDSSPYGTVVVFRNVTERTLAETAARHRADFEEKLIGIVSHDLRNPLNAIVLGARALLMREDLDQLTAKLAVRIQSSAQRATRLVDDLLDFTQARLGSGIPINRKPIDLRDIAEQVLEELAAAFPEREIAFEAQGETRGEWDADRIAQILTNLVTNALKHGAQSAPVRVSARGGDGWTTIEVHNRGEPIAEAMLPVIFHPMKRGGANRGDRSVGLGLYIVKHIIDAHGGGIEVTSTQAAGTRFVVRLPRAPAPGKLPG